MSKGIIHIIMTITLITRFISVSAQLPMPDTVCVGMTKHYKVNDAFVSSTYTWKVDGHIQPAAKNEMVITWTTSGKFLITVQEHSANGCDGEIQSGYVYVNTTLSGVRYPTITATANVAKQLSARNLGIGASYNWTPLNGLDFSNIQNPVFKYDRTTDYLINITPPKGCTLIDTLTVFVEASTSAKSSLYVPTAWTPNNDGHNDKLIPLTTNIRQLHFKIFNRWGQLLFETNKPGEGWDGTFNGMPQTPGVYVWFADAEGWDGIHHKQNGTSVLIR